MSHKINDLNGSAPGAAASVGTSRAQGATAPGASSSSDAAAVPAATGDVHITDTAARLALLEPALREAPAVDPARVAAIRAAIESGQYAVRPEHVATQLLQVEQSLAPLQGGPVAPLAPPDTTEPS